MMVLECQARKLRAAGAAWILSLPALVVGAAHAQVATVGIQILDNDLRIPNDWEFLGDHLIVRADSQSVSPTVSTFRSPVFSSGVELEDESRLELFGATVHGGLALNDASVASFTSREIVDYVAVRDASRLETSGGAVSKPWQVSSMIAMDDATLVLDDGRVGMLLMQDRTKAHAQETEVDVWRVSDETTLNLGDIRVGTLLSEDESTAMADNVEVDSWTVSDNATLVLNDSQVNLLRLEGQSTADIRNTRIEQLKFLQSRDLSLQGGRLGDFTTVAGTNLALDGVELGGGTLQFSTDSSISGSAWTGDADVPKVSFFGDFDYSLEFFDRPPQDPNRNYAEVSLEMQSSGWVNLNTAAKATINLSRYGALSAEGGALNVSFGSGIRPSIYDFAANFTGEANRPRYLLKLPHAEVQRTQSSVRGVLGDGSEFLMRVQPWDRFIVSTSETAFDEFRPLVFYNPANGHYYEAGIGRLAWPDARDQAAQHVYGGAEGYLATITSESEQQFINETFDGLGGFTTHGVWIGASDAEVEGEWRWVDGPEAGELFWLGDEDGEAVGYANWEPATEPNNAGNEDYISWNWRSGTLQWNDYNGSQDAYLIEYEPVPGDANGDGVADLADFAALRAHFGDYADRAHGDLNTDLFVDLEDFQMLKAGFAASAVPEPGAGVLALLGIGLTSLICRRAR